MESEDFEHKPLILLAWLCVNLFFFFFFFLFHFVWPHCVQVQKLALLTILVRLEVHVHGRSTLAKSSPFSESSAAAWAHFFPGNLEGFSLTVASHPSMKLFGAEKCPDSALLGVDRQGRPGMLQSMGSQRIGHNWVTELNWTESFQCAQNGKILPTPSGLISLSES